MILNHNFKRRDFLSASAVFLLGQTLWPKKALAHDLNVGTLPILQGVANASTTQITILSPDCSLLLQVLDPSGSKVAFNHSVHSHEHKWHLHRLSVSNLSPNRIYTLHAIDNVQNIYDSREFSTLSDLLTVPKIIFVSCMRDRYVEEQKQMWATLQSQKPDLLVLMGDNVYVDDGSPDSGVNAEWIWRRYVETRQTVDLYKFNPLIPTLATWDDHDFGVNNSTCNFNCKDESAEIFNLMYGQDDLFSNILCGPGIARRCTLFNQDFYMMDDRSFRSKPLFTFFQSHWGHAQTEWLLMDLRSSPRPAWIINGSQFFGGYMPASSFEFSHPIPFRKLLHNLKKIKHKPIVFCSGDIHYSEIMEINEISFKTYEFTSSSIHSSKRPIFPNNKRRLMATEGLNFLSASVEQIDPLSLDISVAAIGQDQRTLFQLENLRVEPNREGVSNSNY